MVFYILRLQAKVYSSAVHLMAVYQLCYFGYIAVGADVRIIMNMNLEQRRKRLTCLGTSCISPFNIFSGCLEAIFETETFAPFIRSKCFIQNFYIFPSFVGNLTI
jgi:hypothetical protein